VGITGKGKSKLLENCIVQDIRAKRPVILIDPHSDLVFDVLRSCLSEVALSVKDAERVIYFEPTQPGDHVIPFNVLAGPEEPYQIAQRVVEAFRRTWPDSLREAAVFSNVASAALITLVENHLTLIDMHRVLTDKPWRDRLLANTHNPEVVSFFKDRYDKWGRDAPFLRESTLNKVAAFTFNPYLRLILGQQQTISLRRIMDEGKVLLVDLGRCDGETRRLLGSLLVTGLEQAAVGRHDVPIHKRRAAYAYIDEFQDFASNSGSVKSFAQILSECRKFGLHLTLAHQHLGQLSERMIAAIGNIQTRVVFAVSRRDAEWLAREVGQVDTEAIKHDAQTDTQHPVYQPLIDQYQTWTDRLRFQKSRQATVASQDGRVARIWTIPIPPYRATERQVEEVKRASVARWGIPRAQAQRHIQNIGDSKGRVESEDALYYEPSRWSGLKKYSPEKRSVVVKEQKMDETRKKPKESVDSPRLSLAITAAALLLVEWLRGRASDEKPGEVTRAQSQQENKGMGQSREWALLAATENVRLPFFVWQG
jgi:hypothetical protein